MNIEARWLIARARQRAACALAWNRELPGCASDERNQYDPCCHPDDCADVAAVMQLMGFGWWWFSFSDQNGAVMAAGGAGPCAIP